MICTIAAILYLLFFFGASLFIVGARIQEEQHEQRLQEGLSDD
ncbi:hypothetical protein [Flavimaribacter sediminis]|nr:hypothetical protein [Flavimaribacter sediminis]